MLTRMLIHCYGHRSPITEHHWEIGDARASQSHHPTWVLNSVEKWSCEWYFIMLQLGTPLFHRRPRRPGTGLWLRPPRSPHASSKLQHMGAELGSDKQASAIPVNFNGSTQVYTTKSGPLWKKKFGYVIKK